MINYNSIKKILDFLVSVFCLIVLSPVFMVVTLILFISTRTNPFFTQDRPGKSGKIFKLIKFKTMTDESDSSGKLLPDEKRLTKVGKFVRSTSLDEIPQLINVLKGDMSLVGPRPLLVRYLPLYNEKQARRHNVRPGITGWAQVNGRNAISWEQKFDLDVWYVDNISFALDLKIIRMTVMNVLKRKGINSDTSATMEPFKGTGQRG